MPTLMRHAIRTSSDLTTLIRSLRIDQELSQRELASRAGIGRQQISEIESGRSGMHVSTLMGLLTALGFELHVVQRSTEPDQIDLDRLLGLDTEGG